MEESNGKQLSIVPRSIEQAPAIMSGMPTSQELMCYQAWAKNAFDSQMYRSVGKESSIMMIMLAAREYGIGPAQALNGGLHIIEGKVELSARIMSALIRKSRHALKIVESTEKKCTIWGRRSDTGEEHTVTFTIEEAQQAGLIKDKGGWKRTPIDMLYARAISRLARQLFSDVIGIGYIEGEISDSVASVEVLEASVEKTMSVDNDITNSLMEKLVNKFHLEDQPLVPEFVDHICQSFDIQKTRLINQFLDQEDKTFKSFENWKQKRNKNESNNV